MTTGADINQPPPEAIPHSEEAFMALTDTEAKKVVDAVMNEQPPLSEEDRSRLHALSDAALTAADNPHPPTRQLCDEAIVALDGLGRHVGFKSLDGRYYIALTMAKPRPDKTCRIMVLNPAMSAPVMMEAYHDPTGMREQSWFYLPWNKPVD